MPEKNIQIPMELLVKLIRYFLLEPTTEDADAIKAGLEKKLQAMMKRELYTQSFTAATPAEQDAARQKYLDTVGIPPSYRWSWEHETERRKHE